MAEVSEGRKELPAQLLDILHENGVSLFGEDIEDDAEAEM